MQVGCSPQSEPPADPAAEADVDSQKQVPPHLDKIFATRDPGAIIGWTYWYCDDTGALLEVCYGKNSWWWAVEPEDASKCDLERVSKEKFDELDPRSREGA